MSTIIKIKLPKSVHYLYVPGIRHRIGLLLDELASDHNLNLKGIEINISTHEKTFERIFAEGFSACLALALVIVILIAVFGPL